MAIHHIVIHCSATTNGKPLRTSSQSAAERIDEWHQNGDLNAILLISNVLTRT